MAKTFGATHTVRLRKKAGKWDAVFLSKNGNTLWFSNQGYENKKDLINVIAAYHRAVLAGTVSLEEQVNK